jgi:hypothetical protein
VLAWLGRVTFHRGTISRTIRTGTIGLASVTRPRPLGLFASAWLSNYGQLHVKARVVMTASPCDDNANPEHKGQELAKELLHARGEIAEAREQQAATAEILTIGVVEAIVLPAESDATLVRSNEPPLHGRKIVQKHTRSDNVVGPIAVGKQHTMPDAVEAFGEDVDEEAANKLVGVERHRLAARARAS